MAASDFTTLARKIGQLQQEMSGANAERHMTVIGVAAKRDALQAVKSDLGDDTMSGWWRASGRRPNRKPIPIVTAFNVVNDTQLSIYPRGASAGPWRVLEEGRKESAKGSEAAYSKRRRLKSGEVVIRQYTRARKRNSGATPAKKTWSKAVDLIVARTPARANHEFVVKPMTDLFTR